MTSLKRLQDYLLHVTVAIIIFVLGVWLVLSMLPKPLFDDQTYQERQALYVSCIQNDALFETAKQVDDSLLSMSLEDIQNKTETLKQIPRCDATHVESSYKQVQEMALLVVDFAKTYYQDQEIKVVNAVYTVPSQIAALLNHPQAYLFFVSNQDQSKITAIRIYMENNQPNIFAYWDVSQSSDLTFTQTQVQKLVLWFSEIKK